MFGCTRYGRLSSLIQCPRVPRLHRGWPLPPYSPWPLVCCTGQTAAEHQHKMSNVGRSRNEKHISSYSLKYRQFGWTGIFWLLPESGAIGAKGPPKYNRPRVRRQTTWVMLQASVHNEKGSIRAHRLLRQPISTLQCCAPYISLFIYAHMS